jgi:protein-tyrosine-phosphatase
VEALKGEPMAPNAVAALDEVGIYPAPHRARQVSEKMIRERGLVLAMAECPSSCGQSSHSR